MVVEDERHFPSKTQSLLEDTNQMADSEAAADDDAAQSGADLFEQDYISFEATQQQVHSEEGGPNSAKAASTGKQSGCV